MKTLAILLLAGALAAGFVERSRDSGTPVVTVGPLEAPLLPPRARVTNEHGADVGVSYMALATGEIRGLGTVSPNATRTFQFPEALGAIRIVAQSWEGSEQFVSGTIELDERIDVALVVGHRVGESTLEVMEVDVVRTR